MQGAAAAPGAQGTMGLSVLLHGDGGQSFDAFPNKNGNGNDAGVVIRAPKQARTWGGNGPQRPDSFVHSKAVADIVTNELPRMVAFNASDMTFAGVSGGAIMLSSTFMPTQMGKFLNAKVINMCGASAPTAAFTPEAAAAMANTHIHFQSTTNELDDLQPNFSKAINAYAKAAADAGLNQKRLGPRRRWRGPGHRQREQGSVGEPTHAVWQGGPLTASPQRMGMMTRVHIRYRYNINDKLYIPV